MLAVFTTFLLEKTRCDLLHNYNLISQRKGGEKKKEAKQNPPPRRLQTRRSALICSEMGFPLKHILCGKLCFFFFFSPSPPFWTSGTNRAEQAWRYCSVLSLCHVKITRHHPVFVCVCICLFFVNAISVQSLLNSFIFGAEGSKAVRVVGLPHGQQAQASVQGGAGPEVPASQTDSINKEFGESSIYACLCALNERQRLQRHAY